MLPGAPELAIILVIVLILFGAGKLPQVFEAFGKGIKQFRDAQQDDHRDDPQDVTRKEIPAARKAEEAEEIRRGEKLTAE